VTSVQKVTTGVLGKSATTVAMDFGRITSPTS
jgi:hypothetical protein